MQRNWFAVLVHELARIESGNGGHLLEDSDLAHTDVSDVPLGCFFDGFLDRVLFEPLMRNCMGI